MTELEWRGLPRNIKIGHYQFRIMLVADEHPELDGCDGMCNFTKFRIYIPVSLPLQRAINVVQHELSHAINWVYGVEDESTEEIFTTQHTNGLIDLWVANPKIFQWLAKSLRQMKKDAATETADE